MTRPDTPSVEHFTIQRMGGYTLWTNTETGATREVPSLFDLDDTPDFTADPERGPRAFYLVIMAFMFWAAVGAWLASRWIA